MEGGDGVSNGSFRASPLGGDAVFCGPQVHAVEDKTLLSPATSPTAVIDYGNMEGGDKNWYISESGNYRIVFDLKNARVSISQDFSEVLPVITPSIYAVGDATVGGWTPAFGTPLTVDETDPYIFTYQTYMKGGAFKFSLRNDKEWDGNWIHPVQNTAFGADGLKKCAMEVFRGADLNDNLWTVSEAGTYKITLDLRNMEMSAEYLSDKVIANHLYLVGDLTNWSFQPMEQVSPNVFEATFDNCESGKRFRASMAPVWGTHLRPEVDNTELAIDNKDGLDIKTDQNEDYNWATKEPGTYKIRFDLNKMKVSANNEPTTSITEIIQDGGDVTCEYFNLQGIRVMNPVAGEVYIQRTGTTVRKVIIR
ncbi:SusF/SusE family outer membrane protein [Muribaculum intestinale]|uniref:SusF/SusE family outer membrane protein n=1 Tax=Muribaculum intestinale TaxID=1796646 RepID=UPI0025B3D532|nr:SusF/SusE family outer membrane protein [Muribaculum intestinale]